MNMSIPGGNLYIAPHFLYPVTLTINDTLTTFLTCYLNALAVAVIFEPLEYKKRLLLRSIRHFIKSDWINNMDHMRISGIEPSSVTLSQTK